MTRSTIVSKTNRELRNALQKMPPFPETLPRLAQAIKDQESTDKLANILKNDPALATIVLKLAQSPFYRRAYEINDIFDATQMLGTRTLLNICSAAFLCQVVQSPLRAYGIEPATFLKHSLATAYCARIIADVHKHPRPNTTYTAALLHDIGKLVITKMVDKQNVFNDNVLITERDLCGWDHPTAGYELARKWQLPNLISMGIRYHHDPTTAPHHRHLCAIVYTANKIAQYSNFSTHNNDITQQQILHNPIIIQMGITSSSLNKLKDILQETIHNLI
ncbi:HDIG domain-containing protein [Desulfacinum hydrothermale DSM 13146]|uniref:HDIG domain-containing protein n=1 Tax=Desulfacinum hydrothermale DSM 13146 TaxID=1121390 RepID=A0A1W1XWG4_9BACT|nr:HDOD domain-containing protein [Desulfacinum hydrothermale]SMC28309.1 HDIG domain-containing protein [Desulfacinum hydrothermale DSM 13146]